MKKMVVKKSPFGKSEHILPSFSCLYCAYPRVESVTKYPGNVVRSKPKINLKYFNYFFCTNCNRYFMETKHSHNRYELNARKKQYETKSENERLLQVSR